MEFTVPQFVLWLAGQLIVAAGIWGAIRADIKSIRERMVRVERRADEAHNRLNDHLERRADRQGRRYIADATGDCDH